jgi:hypothetical protein
MAFLIHTITLLFLITLTAGLSSQTLALLRPMSDNLEEVVIKSPSPTNWGTWGSSDNCPTGTFVFGMQLKSQVSHSAFIDETALNGLRMFCKESSLEDYNSGKNPSEAIVTSISSSVHTDGSWKGTYNCSNGGIATGFQMRNEGSGGFLVDDTAANNVRLFCDGNKRDFIEGDGTSFGQWTGAQHCPPRTGFCGIKTQIYTGTGECD